MVENAFPYFYKHNIFFVKLLRLKDQNIDNFVKLNLVMYLFNTIQMKRSFNNLRVRYSRRVTVLICYPLYCLRLICANLTNRFARLDDARQAGLYGSSYDL